MKIRGINVLDLRRKLYQKNKDFKRFQNINEERQEELRKDISYLTASNQKLDLYIRMLELLISNQTTNYTFDEKLFCLIEACDPNLDYLRMFNRFGNPNPNAIEYKQYENEIRRITGFFDDTLRKYEYFYLKTIVFKKVSEEPKNSDEKGKILGRTIR